MNEVLFEKPIPETLRNGIYTQIGNVYVGHSYATDERYICERIRLTTGTKLKDAHIPKSTWAIVVSTSRFYANYRHTANALGVYNTIRRFGISDRQIILMLADNTLCNPRNPYPGGIFSCVSYKNAPISSVQVDYQGHEVTVETFRRVLTGRHPRTTPASKRILSDAHSNVLIYITGHSGNGFLKFHDAEEFTALALADAVRQMYLQKRFKRLMVIADTCHAETILARIDTPDTITIGSSSKNEMSFSHGVDLTIGSYVVDRLTYHMVTYLSKAPQMYMNTSIAQMLQVLSKERLQSTISISTTSPDVHVDNMSITTFWGNDNLIESFDFVNKNPFQIGFPLEMDDAI